MNYVVRSKASLPKTPAWTVNRKTDIPARPRPLDIVTRRYEIDWRAQNGENQQKACVAPAIPAFENAFSALAQGTLVQTDRGHVAVEDLQPGDMIATAAGPLQPLLWRGCMTIFPQQRDLGLSGGGLFRLTGGGYGHERDGPDLLLGPAARILAGELAIDSSSQLLNPGDLVDGDSVIAINPASSVRVFHLALASHQLIRANGVLIESYHPGADPLTPIAPELRGHFAALFPHIRSFDDFGPLNHKRAA